MATKELTHIAPSRHLFTPQVAANLNTTAFDTLGNEAPAIYLDLNTGNLSASVSIAFTLQESISEVLGGPFTTVDPMFTEWFMDGIPGNAIGAAGSQVWTRSIPGYGGVLTLNTETGLTGHTFAVSYPGGQHRYIRVNIAVVGVPTNMLAAMGLLGSPRQTAGLAYNNYPAAADFPSISFPV